MLVEAEKDSDSAAEQARSRVVKVAAYLTVIAVILAVITSYLKLHT